MPAPQSSEPADEELRQLRAAVISMTDELTRLSLRLSALERERRSSASEAIRSGIATTSSGPPLLPSGPAGAGERARPVFLHGCDSGHPVPDRAG